MAPPTMPRPPSVRLRLLTLLGGLNLWILAFLLPLGGVSSKFESSRIFLLCYAAGSLLLLFLGVLATSRFLLLFAFPLSLGFSSLLLRVSPLLHTSLAVVVALGSALYLIVLLRFLAPRSSPTERRSDLLPGARASWYPSLQWGLALLVALVLFYGVNLSPEVIRTVKEHYRGQVTQAQALLNGSALLTWGLLVLLLWAPLWYAPRRSKASPGRVALYGVLVLLLIATLLILRALPH